MKSGQARVTVLTLFAADGNDDAVLAIPCPAQHKFHLGCLRLWFEERTDISCPLDRTKIEFDGHCYSRRDAANSQVVSPSRTQQTSQSSYLAS